MTTRLYLRNRAAADFIGGTLPNSEQSAGTADAAFAGDPLFLNTISPLNANEALTHNSVATLASAAAKQYYYGAFISLPLDGDQSVGAGSIGFNLGGQESNLNANFALNRINLYVWRPSTGVKVGTIKDMPGVAETMATAEPLTTNSNYSMVATFTGVAVSALSGDVIVAEIWGAFTQSSASIYGTKMYFSGTTSPTVNGASLNSPASNILLSETLVFATATAGVGAIAIQSAVSGVGTGIKSSAATIAIQATVDARSRLYAEGTAAIAIQSACSGVGRRIQAGVASIGVATDVEGVSSTPPILLGAAQIAISVNVSGVGSAHFPHRFEQEEPLTDPWVKEASI